MTDFIQSKDYAPGDNNTVSGYKRVQFNIPNKNKKIADI
jgi:hypothetical protein